MRSQRIREELALLEKRYGLLEHDDNLTWFVVPRFPLLAGWNATETRVMVLLPPGYPTTPPDNFYTDSELRLANGGSPGNTSNATPVGGDAWLMFSFHVLDDQQWKPHEDVTRGHNLLDYLDGVAGRLAEAS